MIARRLAGLALFARASMLAALVAPGLACVGVNHAPDCAAGTKRPMHRFD